MTEIESNGEIYLLDLHISREINGNLSCNVYRKPTFSGSYLKFDSYNPQKYKRAVVKALSDRAKKICDDDNLSTEREKIRVDLKKNGYPLNFINGILNREDDSGVRTQDHQSQSQKRYISTPYIKGTSERVGKLFSKYDIILSNKSTNSLRSKLSKVKDKRKTSEKIDVVYQIDCNDCEKVYIGETKKPTKERIREHEMAVVNRNNLSLVFKHCEENNHTMNFDEYNVLNQNKNTNSRKLLESFHSYCNSNSINRSMHFSEIYRPTMKKIIKNS